MKIIQITDLHIGEVGEDTRGVDVRQNFTDILRQVKRLKADHLIITGDLCYNEGERDIYLWIKSQLDDLNIPYDMISGNHDDSVLMAQVFQRTTDLKDGLLYYKKELGGVPCFFLDTEKGYLSGTQLDWLQQEIADIKTPILLFMHYPPVYANFHYLEQRNHLTNKADFQEIIFKSGLPTTIFCGHYHGEKTIQTKNIITHITPSCYIQFNWRTPAFQIDHNQIALREIEIKEDVILSAVLYFKGNKL